MDGRQRVALGKRCRAGIAYLFLAFTVLFGLAACGATTPAPQATVLGAAEHGKWAIDWVHATRARRLAIAAAWLRHDPAATAGEKEFVTPADLVSQIRGPAAGNSLNANLSAAAEQAIGVLGQQQLDDGLHGGGLVGTPMEDVEELLGGPDNEQVVGGHTVWDYMPPVAATDAEYAVIFDGNTVRQVDNAGS